MCQDSGDVNMSGRLALVPQQAWMRNASLKDNILFGKEIQEKIYQR